MVYNLDLTIVDNEQIVRVYYSPSHREVLGNYPHAASYLDLFRVAQALFLEADQIFVAKRALITFYLASSMPRSSAIFVDVLCDGEKVRRSLVIASLALRSPTTDEYEDLW
jgi:hypothetical protein